MGARGVLLIEDQCTAMRPYDLLDLVLLVLVLLGQALALWREGFQTSA